MEGKVEGNEAVSSQPNNQPTNNQPKNGAQANQKRFRKRKQLQHSADIVFSRGASIQTMPSLSKQLKDVTECVIGLQYVWEYRSPTKSVPPHYQCKLCAVSRLQHDMLSHVKGWKHSFRYLKKAHPDKVTCEEEEAVKDPAVRKSIKEVAAEVAKTEGMGQLKVILKEPCDVPAFKGFRSATPKMMPPPMLPPPGKGPMGPFGPRFPNQRFPGEFPPNDGPFSDFSQGEYGPPNFGGFPPRQGFPDADMGRRPFQDGMGRRPAGMGEGFGPEGGRDDFRRGGPMEDEQGRMFHDEFQRPMGNNLMDRPVNKPLDGGNNSNALLSYLDTFRIENESDAQLVLKVTQKLTDVLMEYRLRSVSTGSTLSSFSLNSTGFSSTPSRLPSSTGRYSNSLSTSSLSGPSRYSDGPSRF